MTPFFFFFTYFLSSNCLRYSFLYLKIIKIHFYEVPPLVHSGLQITWILVVKAVRSEFCPIRGAHAPSLFFPITCFFAITLKNCKLCYLTLN